MYIKSVVIDGFKSYAQRTEVNGFDPMFNAITGLNGSGKSNILDSICFVLGISNLTQVRASNLQELVYKNGQAGINKATVSITFDNSDKKQSPLGYEQYNEIAVTRQVVIGGRNKYLINGCNANNTRVQDLFRSVQLNVNNPHFLIMQGRITKVLNMKPPEILSMIEEAAGTRLYESKKEAAQRTIEKKDAKLKEIDTLLKEDINPTLNKLKEERSSYLEYQNILRSLEHLTKLYTAWQFVCAEETKDKSMEKFNNLSEAMVQLRTKCEEMNEEATKLDHLINELQNKRDEEAGGIVVQLEAKLSEQQKLDTKSQSNINSKKDSLKAEQKKLKETKKQITSDQKVLDSKNKEFGQHEESLEKLKQSCAEAKEAHAASQNHYHAVTAGLSTNEDGSDASLNDQLMVAKKEISTAETSTKTAQMTLKHAQAEVKKKQQELKKTEHIYKKDQTQQHQLQDSIKKMKAELAKLNYDEELELKLEDKQTALHRELDQLRVKVDDLEQQFPQLQFDYRDPEKNFDRSKVHGLVAKLVKIKDVSTATALEVSAGGKLYNIIVDSEVTGKKLLQKGELKRRYTIIPLNKISARCIDNQTVRRAEQLVGKDNVHTALSLVGYENDLEKAMQFVFGGSFVCTDMDTAKRVTYDKGVMRKCVTLEGDSFDPAGTLTGGARAQRGSVLSRLSAFQEAEEQLRKKTQELHNVEQQLDNLQAGANRYRTLKEQCDLKEHELAGLEDRQKQTNHHQQLEEINDLQQSIEDNSAILNQAEETKKKATEKVKQLENKLKNAKQEREKELKNAEQAVNKAKKHAESLNKQLQEKEQGVYSIKLEADELQKEIDTNEETCKAIEKAIADYQGQVDDLVEASKETKAAVAEAQAELKKQKDHLRECNKDIENKAAEHSALLKESKAGQLQVQELKHKISKCNEEAEDAAKLVSNMLRKYTWITEEKQYFGKPNTAYDFAESNPKEAGKRIQVLTESKEKLAKNVNMRAMNMLGKAEEQCADLMKRRTIVLNDKKKIASVIAELDQKKNEALKKAHAQVNKDFGSIFSTLLPGTKAKLVAPDGQTILDGLEVKVAFGDVWKESLGELSGGQRSLVALSLILSMLLFKPAPLYILDEVDAALDLSHTQNIGQMLKNHFKQSQFIVVSLKDGMFNNANVLFRTKFVDGISCVSRHTQIQSGRTNASAMPTTTAKDKTKQKNKRPRIVD